jgi:hypothetical protein
MRNLQITIYLLQYIYIKPHFYLEKTLSSTNNHLQFMNQVIVNLSSICLPEKPQQNTSTDNPHQGSAVIRHDGCNKTVP